MKISIITICYNNEKDIRPTIESVIGQTYSDIEYIIIDGASKDSSLSIIYEYKNKIDKIISESDNGMYEAINKGIKMATGDVVGLIHAGDRLYESTTIEKIAEFYKNNNVDISYGHSKIVNEYDISKRINVSPQYSRSLVRRGWMPSHQSIYCKRELFEKYGYYRNDLGGGGDYEWFLRYFYKYGEALNIKLIDNFIIRFSLGGQSTKNIKSKFTKKHFEYVKKCWELNDLTPPRFIVLRMFLRKIKQFALAKLDK